MANNNAALAHFEAARATLRGNSAAGFPESNIAQTIQRLDAGIAIMKGEEAAPIREPVAANNFPPTHNRGDVPVAPKPVVVSGKPAGKAAVVSIGKYADGWTVEGDRSTFPPQSPGGAKRLSVEPKK